MTREEEIKLVASCHIADSIENYKKFYEGFIHGAKWADKNPQGMAKMRKDYEFLFMLKKKELINKACKWIKKHKDNYIIDIEGETIVDCSIVKDFHKAMEE